MGFGDVAHEIIHHAVKSGVQPDYSCSGKATEATTGTSAIGRVLGFRGSSSCVHRTRLNNRTMIETSATAWAGLICIVCLATLAGAAVTRMMPWNDQARLAGMPFSTGIAIGPFLAGLATVLALLILPRAEPSFHLGFVITVLLLLSLLLLRKVPVQIIARQNEQAPKSGLYLLHLLLTLWVVALLVNAIFIPLTQNDSLEYATVGRLLYESRTLEAYPVLDSATNTSGFYGPWTHPPLYVSLIYLTSIIQGHANEPGLMRLVAPWAVIVTTRLVYVLGALQGRLTGMFSALVFISAPLYFLGAESALSDALPVLGLLLIFVVLVYLDGTAIIRGAITGLVLGMALWTHSQAILFIPLTLAAVVLRSGFTNIRALAQECGILLIVATVLAFWPYWRNTVLFGSPISDNPIVFGLPTLAWHDYFTTGRGIDHFVAVVQYGWLKGWFAIEAYGMTFWLMLLGVVAWQPRLTALPSIGYFKMVWSARPNLLLKIASGLVLCYLAGVVASTILGLDLMIKNERYLLVILPLAALLAGSGLAALFETGAYSPNNRRVPLKVLFGVPFGRVVAGTVVLVLAAELLVLTSVRYVSNGLSPAKLGQRFTDTLRARSEYLVMEFLRRSTPPDSVVFSLKPADMYYAARKMLSYLDPALVPFYAQPDPAQALAMLKRLGVTHVHLPDYGLPPLYNSTLEQILRNPEWATLDYQADGSQIYKLSASGLTHGSRQDIAPGKSRWTSSTNLLIGGRKALFTVEGDNRLLSGNAPSEGGLRWGLFHRNLSTMLTVGAGMCTSNSLPDESLPAAGGREYALDLTLVGHGLVRIWMQQFDKTGPIQGEHLRSQTKTMIGDLVLGDRYPTRQFSRRLKMLSNTRCVTFSVEHVGRSMLTIERAYMTEMTK